MIWLYLRGSGFGWASKALKRLKEEFQRCFGAPREAHSNSSAVFVAVVRDERPTDPKAQSTQTSGFRYQKTFRSCYSGPAVLGRLGPECNKTVRDEPREKLLAQRCLMAFARPPTNPASAAIES